MKKWQQYMAAMVVGTLGAVDCANAQDSTNVTTTTTDNDGREQATRAQQLNKPQAPICPYTGMGQNFPSDLFGSGSINNETINRPVR